MTTPGSAIWAFFYGTIMNPAVMKDFGVTVTEVFAAKLPGFDLVIRPRPNLIRSDRAVVFGSLMAVTHDDLTTLYSGLENSFGIKYVPEAVLATTRAGFVLPALCYIVPNLPDSAPDPAFLKQFAQCVRSMGHPEWYAAHVESLSAPVKTENR
jgi:Gamma-glutamyl cyclotransferase, AIG2-like